jgi:hypothetical protein
MDGAEVQRKILAQYGIRVEPEMGDYVARQWALAANAPVAVLGADARTGVPVRMEIDPALLGIGEAS